MLDEGAAVSQGDFGEKVAKKRSPKVLKKASVKSVAGTPELKDGDKGSAVHKVNTSLQGDHAWGFDTRFCRIQFGNSTKLPICHAVSVPVSQSLYTGSVSRMCTGYGVTGRTGRTGPMEGGSISGQNILLTNPISLINCIIRVFFRLYVRFSKICQS